MLPALVSVLAVSLLAPTGEAANGTTLPFQRHIVRAIAPGHGGPTFAAVVQKQGADHDGLTLYTSIDGGTTWHRDLAIQPDARVRDTADLLPDAGGRGFLLLYSLEPESSRFREDPRSEVVLLHLVLVRPGNFRVEGRPTVVFRPAAGEAYFRASLARDAGGVLHVAATRLSGGTFSWVASASRADGSFGPPATLFSSGVVFGGGRIVTGGRLVLAVYDDYAVGHPGRYRVRGPGPAGRWGPEHAFAPDGLYHAGAFSITATHDGHAHLAYSDKAAQALHYREFDGRGWSARATIEPVGYWSNQVAVSDRAGTVLLAWNHFDPATGMMGIRTRERDARGLGPVHLVVPATNFKGYTTAIETVLPGEPWIIGWSEQRTLMLPPAKAVTVSLRPRLPGLVATPSVLRVR